MKNKGTEKWKGFRYKGLLGILLVFLFMGGILFAERSGIRYTLEKQENTYLDRGEAPSAKEVFQELPRTCLALTDSSNEGSQALTEEFSRIFLDMKVGYDLVDVRSLEENQSLPFENYETVVVILSDMSTLKQEVLHLASWVEKGGGALFAMTLERESYLMLIEQKLGIVSAGYDYAVVDNIYPAQEFMIGGGKSYSITDPFDSAWAVELSEKAELHAWTEGKKKIPLIWEMAYGEGRFVVDNLGYYERVFRGFYAASYSLLTQCTAYPVINGSTFYLDDFPSPVPSGNGEYIMRDYGTSIEEFYTNIWWPDMLSLAEKYGIRYTGVIIENYEDTTEGDPEPNKDTEQFQYFGNMLLHQRGEIGYHGYNHQPLSLPNTDYGDVLPYKTWKNYSAMKSSIEELTRFGEEMFPAAVKSVYVPPSNVLSSEGRKMLAEEFPQIRTIASNYLSDANDEFVYQQEFEVAEDGMVEQPRVISGGILDDYMRISALSELNMHFVNNHFMHPDDLLDEDRGAALGWEAQKKNLDSYMSWLYHYGKGIRNLTGSELSGAIQRFAAVSLTKEVSESQIRFQIKNLYDQAYFLVRFNQGKPGKTTGGTLEHITGDLYLLCAESEEVHIEMSR